MFSKVEQAYSEDISAIQDWVQEMFSSIFGESFNEIQSLYAQLKNADHPIGDAELERLLTILPLDLVEASEKLNGLRLTFETVKLKNKDTERDLNHKYSNDKNIPATVRKDIVDSAMSEYKLYAIAYSALISRAEGHISFCKEMIMAAKKIFDSRRAAEAAIPIGPGVPLADNPHPDLPSYANRNGTYVK